MRRFICLAFGTTLLLDGTHALWRHELHQGRFFAVASLLIALGGLTMMYGCMPSVSNEDAPRGSPEIRDAQAGVEQKARVYRSTADQARPVPR